MVPLIMHRNFMTLWNFCDGAAICLGFWVLSWSGEFQAVRLHHVVFFLSNWITFYTIGIYHADLESCEFVYIFNMLKRAE